jgi:two-component system sensor histidine kinase DesK
MRTPHASSQLILSSLFAAQLSGILAAPVPMHRLALPLTLFTTGALSALHLFIALPAGNGRPSWPSPAGTGSPSWPPLAGASGPSWRSTRRARASWATFVITMTSVVAVHIGLWPCARAATYLTITAVTDGLVVFGLTRLHLRFVRAHGACSHRASVRERERFAMDLHDIFGYSLSAITLKAELTRRLIDDGAEPVQRELAEIIDLARQTAADSRLTAHGYWNMSLAREAESVASVLFSAGVTAQVDIDCGALDDKVDAVLATVLREAALNVLRHSAARNCVIELSQADGAFTLAVLNDGVPRQLACAVDGRGLRNMSCRLKAVGGNLSTGVGDDGEFRLVAKVPEQAALRYYDCPGASETPPADHA